MELCVDPAVEAMEAEAAVLDVDSGLKPEVSAGGEPVTMLAFES